MGVIAYVTFYYLDETKQTFLKTLTILRDLPIWGEADIQDRLEMAFHEHYASSCSKIPNATK